MLAMNSGPVSFVGNLVAQADSSSVGGVAAALRCEAWTSYSFAVDSGRGCKYSVQLTLLERAVVADSERPAEQLIMGA